MADWGDCEWCDRHGPLRHHITGSKVEVWICETYDSKKNECRPGDGKLFGYEEFEGKCEWCESVQMVKNVKIKSGDWKPRCVTFAAGSCRVGDHEVWAVENGKGKSKGKGASKGDGKSSAPTDRPMASLEVRVRELERIVEQQSDDIKMLRFNIQEIREHGGYKRSRQA
jgi:hypothetical protein